MVAALGVADSRLGALVRLAAACARPSKSSSWRSAMAWLLLIKTPDGRAFLYDCGRLGDPSVGRRIVAPALWAGGVGRIEAVYLSHADQDHYDGLLDLLDRFPHRRRLRHTGVRRASQSVGHRAAQSHQVTRRPDSTR